MQTPTLRTTSVNVRLIGSLVAAIAMLAALLYMAPSASADHEPYPFVDQLYGRINLFPTVQGPNQWDVDEPFTIFHGLGTEHAKSKSHKDFYVTVQVDTTPDEYGPEPPLNTDAILVPEIGRCVEDDANDLCKAFTYNVHGGIRDILGPDFEGGVVRFRATWYEPCGQSTVLDECPDGIDEDLVVAIIQSETDVEFTDD